MGAAFRQVPRFASEQGRIDALQLPKNAANVGWQGFDGLERSHRAFSDRWTHSFWEGGHALSPDHESPGKEHRRSDLHELDPRERVREHCGDLVQGRFELRWRRV